MLHTAISLNMRIHAWANAYRIFTPGRRLLDCLFQLHVLGLELVYLFCELVNLAFTLILVIDNV